MKVISDEGWTFRLLPETLQQLQIKPRGIIHVGAHHGEEVPIYQVCGFKSITLVEPDPMNCEVITCQPWINDVSLINVACGSVNMRAEFHRTSDSVFSGLMINPGQQTTDIFSTSVVWASTIQISHPANVMVIDTQGTELDVLRSADLTSLDLVIIETQQDGPLAHGAWWPELMAWAAEHHWTPTIQWARDHGWADTLLIPEASRA